jgi:hypothetical protein
MIYPALMQLARARRFYPYLGDPVYTLRCFGPGNSRHGLRKKTVWNIQKCTKLNKETQDYIFPLLGRTVKTMPEEGGSFWL